MRSVKEMQEYLKTRSLAELQAEFELYKLLWKQGTTDIYLELLAIELDSRTGEK